MEGSFLKNIRRYFKQYCNRTSVHGFQYFGEDRSNFESDYMFRIKNENPNIFNSTKIVQKLKETQNLTSEEYRKLNVLRLMCEPLIVILRNFHAPIKIQPEEFFKDLKELHLHLPLQLKGCIFPHGHRSRFGLWICSWMFYPTVTEEGICYSFNMIHNDNIYRENIEYPRDLDSTSDISFLKYSNWSPQNGYDQRYENEEEKEKSYEEYPHRAVAGVNSGLSLFIVSPQQASDPLCQKPIRAGYKMLVHSPITIPRFRQDFIRIPSDANVAVVVKPQVVKTSKKVQNYSPDRRRCYFETERRLKFFKIYTSSNCKLECLTNYTLFMCGCAAFYMPRENDTEICSPTRNSCQKQAEHYMTKVTALNLNLKLFSSFKERHCNCLPACSELFYEVEVTQSKWEWTDGYPYKKSSNQTLTSVTVYFNSDTFIARERNELYGPIDFLSNFGGLIGLFSGFSIMSLIEILYFLSVRIIFNRRLYGQWAGLEN